MIRRSIINVLQAVIDRLEDSMTVKPKPREFNLTHGDKEMIRTFLASPKLSKTDY
jgi:hypothetical protein